MEKLLEFIARFTNISEAEKQVVLSSNKIEACQKGKILKPHHLKESKSFFVLKGLICSKVNYIDRQIVDDFFIEGEPILPPIFDQDENTYEITCIEDSLIAVSDLAAVDRLVERFPAFQTVCMKFAEKKLLEKTSFHNRIKNLTAEEKYLFAIEKRPELQSRIPKHLVASYLGITPETLSRIRNKLDS